MEDLTSWLGELVHQVDSSLLDEWEQLTGPQPLPSEVGRSARRHRPLTANVRAFTVLVRNALFRRVELAARRRYAELGELDAGDGWDAEAWQAALDGYFDEYPQIGIGATARGPALFVVEREPGPWLVRQILDDPAEDRDWGTMQWVDLAASDERGEPVFSIETVGRPISNARLIQSSISARLVANALPADHRRWAEMRSHPGLAEWSVWLISRR